MSSSHPNSSNMSAFIPVSTPEFSENTNFYTSGYDIDSDFEEEFHDQEFSAELITHNNTIIEFQTNAAAAVAGDMIADNDQDYDDSDFVGLRPTFRHCRPPTAPFTHGGSELVLNHDSFTESRLFKDHTSNNTPVFVHDVSPKLPLFVLSPSSVESTPDVPLKLSSPLFHSVNPSFPSQAAPSKIMETLQTALSTLEGDVKAVNQWTLRVNCLVVAEEISFTVSLSKVKDAPVPYEVDFARIHGDEMRFVELCECIRSQCGEVDEESLFFLSKTLDAWMDAKQELKGRRYAIDAKEASTLIEELNTDLHIDTLYQVAKTIKNHCRHKGNRRLFLQQDQKNFVKGLQWMLSDSEELARFAVFILQQYAQDEMRGGDESAAFFTSPFDKSTFALLLDSVLTREESGACARFTSSMVEQVQQSWIFA